MSEPTFVELVDDLIDAVRHDAAATEDGGLGDYKRERAAVLDAWTRATSTQDATQVMSSAGIVSVVRSVYRQQRNEV